jgi:hypothetical protein
MLYGKADSRAPDVPAPVRAAVGGGIIPLSYLLCLRGNMSIIGNWEREREGGEGIDVGNQQF